MNVTRNFLEPTLCYKIYDICKPRIPRVLEPPGDPRVGFFCWKPRGSGGGEFFVTRGLEILGPLMDKLMDLQLLILWKILLKTIDTNLELVVSPNLANLSL